MKLRLIILTLFISNSLFAQRAKEKQVYFKEWHFPTVVVPASINEYKIVYAPISLSKIKFESVRKMDEINLEPVDLDENRLKDGSIFSSLVLNQFSYRRHSNYWDTLLIIKVKYKDVKFKVEIKDNRQKGDSIASYKSTLSAYCEVQITAANKAGINFYEESKKHEFPITELKTYKKQKITSSDLAKELIIKRIEKNIEKYKNDLYEGVANFTKSLGKPLVESIDFYVARTPIPFYLLKDKKGYDFTEINKVTSEMMDLFSLPFSDTNKLKLDEKAKTCINFWLEKTKDYTESDKKDKKVLWALYANIISANYVLGNDEKTIEYNSKVNELDKRKSSTIFNEMVQKRADLRQLHADENGQFKRDFAAVSFSKKNKEQLKEHGEYLKYKALGYLYGRIETNEGIKHEGYLKVNTEIKSDIIKDPSFLDGKSATLLTIDSMGAVSTRLFKAKNCKYLIRSGFDGGDTGSLHKYVALKFSYDGKTKPGEGKQIQLRQYRFAQLYVESKYIKLYQYENAIVLQKPENDYGESTSSLKFQYAFKKELAKFVPDCPEVLEKIKNNEYENEFMSLYGFASDIVDYFED